MAEIDIEKTWESIAIIICHLFTQSPALAIVLAESASCFLMQIHVVDLSNGD